MWRVSAVGNHYNNFVENSLWPFCEGPKTLAPIGHHNCNSPKNARPYLFHNHDDAILFALLASSTVEEIQNTKAIYLIDRPIEHMDIRYDGAYHFLYRGVDLVQHHDRFEFTRLVSRVAKLTVCQFMDLFESCEELC